MGRVKRCSYGTRTMIRKFLRPRFGLRGLLAAVCVCAVICWPLRYVVKHLAEELHEERQWRPYRIAWSRAVQGSLSDDEFVGLCQGMLSDDPVCRSLATITVRNIVAGCLGRVSAERFAPYFPPHPWKALPVLVKALEHSDVHVRFEAVRAIRRMGPPAGSAAEPLRRRLDDGDPSVQWETVFALGALGPDAACALPQLMELLERCTDQRQRTAITAAIENIQACTLKRRENASGAGKGDRADERG